MPRTAACLLLFSLLVAAAACGDSEAPPAVPAAPAPPAPAAHEAHGHDHGHDERSLGVVRIGELEVELAQGHGPLVAGGRAHLVARLPYSDGGGTLVRAWIGSEDRLLSYVGKGENAPAHHDYDVHALAPDPLPEDSRWWIELEQPDGTRLVGSAEPIRD